MTYIQFSHPLPLKIAALTTSRIYFMILHILTKYVIKLAENLNFCANGLVVRHRKGRSNSGLLSVYLKKIDSINLKIVTF